MEREQSNVVVVMGAGRSGLAATRVLRARGKTVWLYDDKPLQELRFVGDLKEDQSLITFFARPLPLCDEISSVVVSPGVDPRHKIVRWATENHVPLLSEIDVAAPLVNHKKVLGITGTNGKSTTTVMMASIMEKAGFKTIACGNLGRPLCDVVLDDHDVEVLVVELSSYQIESSKDLRLDGAIILNITPDHLDRYTSFDDYRDAKLAIIRLLKPAAPLVVNRDIHIDMNNAIKFAADQFATLSHLPRATILGVHNEENAVACATLASALGVSNDIVAAGLSAFQPLPHRCEVVDQKAGITYVNDSKGTTVVAVEKALSMFKEPTHLLLGGITKGEDFSVLNHAHIKNYYVFGRDQEKIMRELPHQNAIACATLEDAFFLAQERAHEGEVILLSPGCASFDQFSDYHHRGETFRNLVMRV